MKHLKNTAWALLLLMGSSCIDNVHYPNSTIDLDAGRLVVTYAAVTMPVEVKSNCKWSASLSGDAGSWLILSTLRETGTHTVSLTFLAHDGDQPRTTELTVVSDTDPNVRASITIVQNSRNEPGFVHISELPAMLGNNTSVVLQDERKVRGIVVSSVADDNYLANTIALQSPEYTGGNGLSVTFSEPQYYSIGEELAVSLSGARLEQDSDHGILRLTPASDDDAQPTETSPLALDPRSISYEDLQGGEWQSMLVTLDEPLEITDAGLGSALSRDLELEDGNTLFTLPLWVREESSFGDAEAPEGSGMLTGIVIRQDGVYTIMPRMENDMDFTNARFFREGVTLPYTFSFKHYAASNGMVKYGTLSYDPSKGYIEGSTEANGSYMTSDDGAVTFKLHLLESGGTAAYNWLFGLFHNQGIHDDLRIGSVMNGYFTSSENTYMLLEMPVERPIHAGEKLYTVFGLASTAGGFGEWTLCYSIDGINYTDISPTMRITTAVNQNANFYYRREFTLPDMLAAGRTLYLKFKPTNGLNVSGGANAGNGANRFVSSITVGRVEEETTPTPAGAVIFEPFDRCAGGVDYMLGDRLSGLANYCGEALSLPGWTSTHLYQRPLYAQIGYVDSQSSSVSAITNQVGSLTTPPFGKAGDFTLSFDAAAYLSPAIGSSASDFGGDSQSALITINGGGTINGSATYTLSGLEYDRWTGFELPIVGATANTTITFAGDPTGRFTRWFIDNICVK